MNDRQHGLAGLLIISGIDLLLAALCAAVGILVLLIGSSAGNKQSRPESNKPYTSWWMLVVISPGQSTSSLTCLDNDIPPRQSDTEVELIYRGTQWVSKTCKLTLNVEDNASQAFTRVMLYTNDQCWSNIKADQTCSDITSASTLPVELSGLVAINWPPLPLFGPIRRP